MSSSTDFIVLLQLVQRNLYYFGGPLLISLGTISCICNILVFIQKTLWKNPCSICLIAFNIVCFLLFYLSLLPVILNIGYNIELDFNNLIYCRIRYYVGFLLTCLPSFYLILAAIDRTFVTCGNIRLNRLSNRSFIYKCLFILTLFWIFFHIHALFHVNIRRFASNYIVCYFKFGLYSIFVSYYTIVINGLVPLVLYVIFSLLIIKNMHRKRIRPFISSYPLRNRLRTHGDITISYRNDRQFIRMLLTELLFSIIFGFIHPSVLLYKRITQYEMKNKELMMKEEFIINISTFSLYIPFCLNFYTNVIVSKTFRKIAKNTILKNRIISKIYSF